MIVSHGRNNYRDFCVMSCGIVGQNPKKCRPSWKDMKILLPGGIRYDYNGKHL